MAKVGNHVFYFICSYLIFWRKTRQLQGLRFLKNIQSIEVKNQGCFQEITLTTCLKEKQSMTESLQLLQTEVHNFAPLPSIFENCKCSQIKGPPPTRFCMKKKGKKKWVLLITRSYNSLSNLKFPVKFSQFLCGRNNELYQELKK